MCTCTFKYSEKGKKGGLRLKQQSRDCICTLQYLLIEQDVISEQGRDSPKIVKQTVCIKRTGWTFCQKQLSKQGFFYQLKTTLYSKTCKFHVFNYRPDYISLRKQENCIKRQKKKENAKKYHRSGWNFFQKIVKRTGSNNCEQGGEKLQNS